MKALDSRQTDWLFEQLWSHAPGTPPLPSGSAVWAILDGARDPRIYDMVRYSGADRICLYAGALPDALARAAPYLIRLDQVRQFNRDLLAAAWGNSWGILFTTQASLDRLRTHFRGFLRVRDERGRRLVFRYYDPRVFREYLPTCTSTELDALFGPVGEFVVEGRDGRTLLRFRREGEGLGRVMTPAFSASDGVRPPSMSMGGGIAPLQAAKPSGA